MTIGMDLGEDSYDILVERGLLAKASQHLNLDGFAFVDTDAEIEKRCGCSIKELIREKSEPEYAGHPRTGTLWKRNLSGMDCSEDILATID